MQRIIIALILPVLLLALPAAAQQEPSPDYAIASVNALFSSDESEVTIQVEVNNAGDTADIDATVNLVSMISGRVIAEDTLPPLPAGATETLDFTFDTGAELFPAGSVQTLRIEVGIDEVEPLGSPTIGNNSSVISINVPQTAGQQSVSNDTETEIPSEEPPGESSEEDTGFVIPLLDVQIDLSDPGQTVPLAGVVAVSVIMLWLLTVILRLLFNRPPSFGRWQPPYANMPPLATNTTTGKRQLWQQQAQNNAILTPCTEGAMHAVKLLRGVDGVNMSGWRIIAVRMSQYDIYGRVLRSQILGSKGLVKQLNRAAHKNLDGEESKRRLRPVARGLTKQIKKKISKRSAMLPIALDIQFKGAHSETRIEFELYQCQQWSWHQLDHWEPEMRIISKNIYESYTYTVHGQTGNETLKEFHTRLENDVLWLLAEMVKQQPTDSVPPDTVSGMKPVEGE